MSSPHVVPSVDSGRWQQAQAWERDHWIGAQRARARFGKNWIWRVLSRVGVVPKYRGDDWNTWWQKAFKDYSFLPPEVDNALEVGCGPYTNIRLIQQRCRPRHLVLSDPLIRTYVHFKLTFVAEAYRRAFCVLDDHPLEALPFADNYFDLVVMINVLDHVQDAALCLRNAIRVIRPGGFFVLGQDLTNAEDAAQLAARGGDVGHPIRLDAEWFKPSLEAGFDAVQYDVLPRDKGRAPEAHYATLLFAGRKRAVA